MANYVGNKRRYNISVAIALMLMTNTVFATSVSLRNDVNNSVLESQHIDATIPHYKYEEELERGELKRKIESEINEVTHLEEDIIEQKLKTANYNGVDISNRTNFLSNDDTSNSTYQANVLDGGRSEFYYMQQLPPAVNPGDPLFNEFDFRTGLLEFEFELEGWSTTNDSTYEVSIMMDEVFGVDSSNNLFLQTAGTTVAKLGELSFSSTADKYGRYGFEFEFEQYDDLIAGNDIFISNEIYQAIADGILGIKITRTRGLGDLFLSESELELEKPSVVPVPPAFALFGSALLFLWGSKRPFRNAA